MGPSSPSPAKLPRSGKGSLRGEPTSSTPRSTQRSPTMRPTSVSGRLRSLLRVQTKLLTTFCTFTMNEEYRIDLKTKNCTKHPLSRPFIPFGMPDGAHYVGAANVGPVNIPDEHATVIIFEGVNEEEKVRYFGEVTAPDCIPVSTSFVSNRTGFVHTMFFDITGGIPDPTVFIPPSNCVAVPPREHHPKFPH